MIERLKLLNFVAFKDIEVSFSPKINVIIGENSCGKTQLLKAAYTLSSIGEALGDAGTITKQAVQETLTKKLLRVYKPSEEKIGLLNYRGSKAKSEIRAHFASGHVFGGTFTSRSRQVALSGKGIPPKGSSGVFVPTKEVLSFVEGISSEASHRPTIESLFDATYFDLSHKLLNSALEREEKAQWANEKIVNRIGGRFEFNGSQVQFKSGQYREYKNTYASESYFAAVSQPALSTSMTAEGFRKVGILQLLLQNSAIGTGINGPFFWDEPEANMNPKLMRLVVEILLELSRNGQQVIVATHDYVLLKWFDLLMDKEGKGDHVKFHALYRDDDLNIKCESAGSYKQLDENAIAATYSELYDEEIDRVLGGSKS